jgi:drug/metabolite transporter (DMT)-like permease
VLSSSSAFFAGYTPLTLCILANCALAGLSTALLLRVLSAVAKEFANAAEIITTALAARALLETPLKPTIGAGAALVIIAMALYSRADSDHAQPRPRARDSETPDNESEASADERRGLLTA